MITINNLEKMKQYYNAKTNTYEFVDEDNYRLDVQFNCDLAVIANINAGNIVARNINANDINANNINANDINANDIKAWNIEAWNIIASGNIEYRIVCRTYHNIECKSIKSRLENGKHFSIFGKIKITKDESKPQEMTIAEIEEALGKKIKIVNNKGNNNGR